MTIEQGTNGQVCAIPTLVTADDLNAYYKSEQAQIWAPVAVGGWGDGLPVYTPTPDPEQIRESTRGIAKQSPEGLLPALGVSQDKLKHWIIQYQRHRALGPLDRLLGKKMPLFEQDKNSAYQFNQQFAKKFLDATKREIGIFLSSVLDQRSELANAVQIDENQKGVASRILISCNEGGGPSVDQESDSLLILESGYLPSLRKVYRQEQAIIATDILLEFQRWRRSLSMDAKCMMLDK